MAAPRGARSSPARRAALSFRGSQRTADSGALMATGGDPRGAAQHHWNPRAARVSPRSGQPQACSGVLLHQGRHAKRRARPSPRTRGCWRCPGYARWCGCGRGSRPPPGPSRRGRGRRLRCWTDPGAGDGRCRCEGAVDQDRPGRRAGIEREARAAGSSGGACRFRGCPENGHPYGGGSADAAGRCCRRRRSLTDDRSAACAGRRREPPVAGGLGAGWRRASRLSKHTRVVKTCASFRVCQNMRVF